MTAHTWNVDELSYLHRHLVVFALQEGGQVSQAKVVLQHSDICTDHVRLTVIFTRCKQRPWFMSHFHKNSLKCCGNQNKRSLMCFNIKNIMSLGGGCFFEFQELTKRDYHSNCVSTNTCCLDLLAHTVDVAVQPVKGTHQAGNGFLAELHAVLEMQCKFLLTTVL